MEEQGMVVKIKKNSCIAFTSDGEYLEVALPKDRSVRLGQEIPMVKIRRFSFLKQFMAAASLLVFILAGQLYLGQANASVAYLTIDINPSIEVAFSAKKKVVSCKGLNYDGEVILSKVRLKGLDLYEAVDVILKQAIADRYLTDSGDNVILTTLTVNEENIPLVELQSVYEVIKNQIETGGLDVEVIIEPVKPEMRHQAENSGLSTGRYFLLQKSDEKGVPVSASEISSMSLGKLEKEKGMTFVQMLKEKEHHDDQVQKTEDDQVQKTEDDQVQKTEKVSKMNENKGVKKGIYVERKNENSEKAQSQGAADKDNPGSKDQNRDESKSEGRQNKS